jgi:arsenite methyltransferase
MRHLASQLSRPAGITGRIVARMLDRGNRAAIVAAAGASGAGAGQVAADIGFGGGAGLRELLDRVGAGGRVHGIEISPAMIARAGRRFGTETSAGRLILHEAGMGRLPLPDASVDALISTNTLYFIDDLAPACAELARVLRPSGSAVVGVADPAAMARMPVTRHGFRLRPVAAIISELEKAGLQVAGDRRVGDSDEAFHLLVCRHIEGQPRPAPESGPATPGSPDRA